MKDVIPIGHNTVKSGYEKLTERMNKFPQGAPPSEYLYKILAVLMNEREAHVMSQLPIKPFNTATASRALRMDAVETAKVLDDLAARALLLDVEKADGEKVYTFPPPMAGFFEFTLMRVRGDIDQKLLSELFHQYLNVEEDFVRDLFVAGETKLGRVLVNEPAIASSSNELHILDYERSSEMVKRASHIGVGMCYCRHKMEHLNKVCDAPMDVCLTLGGVANSLIRHGHARQITVAEAMKVLELSYENNLVQIGENQQDSIPFICNCCGCCCEALLAVRRFGTLNSINTANFLPGVDAARCNGCGLCIKACPIDVISIETMSVDGGEQLAVVDEAACLGCGVCVRACKRGAMSLKSRQQRVITPVNSVHRIMLMAIERNKLHNLIFDNQAHQNHRAMAALLGAILKLPPLKRALASEQMKSKYLVALINKGMKRK